MLCRTLGRTRERVSAIGLGGYHMGVLADERDGIKLVRAAVDLTAGTITRANGHALGLLDLMQYHENVRN